MVDDMRPPPRPRAPQRGQRKAPPSARADDATIAAVIANIGALVEAAAAPVNATTLPALYSAAHGAPLDARALGFKKLGLLLEVGAARGSWAITKAPRRATSAATTASGTWFLARRGFSAAAAPADAADGTILGFYYYAAPEWTAGGRDATVAWLAALCEAFGLGGRVRVATEGVNATVSGALSGCEALRDALTAAGGGWEAVLYKFEAAGPAGRWPGLSVWAADELCGFGADAEKRAAYDAAGAGDRLAPRAFIERARAPATGGGRPPVLVDVRNSYETAIGRFEVPGVATLDPQTATFRDFDAWLDAPSTRAALQGRDVLMYCTGGVRCERATQALRSRLPAQDRGRVAHLEGGVVAYLDACGGPDSLFIGANYVFDRRNRHGANPRGSADVLSKCAACAAPWDVYRGNPACATCKRKLLLCDACLSAGATADCDACAAAAGPPPQVPPPPATGIP